MRTRRLARWLGRLAVVAAFGVAVTVAGVAAANTEQVVPQPWEQVEQPQPPPAETPDENAWD